ncbi:thiamine pyrophosphate-dependent enzyme [Halostreptopolyspora alba]|uniref:Thiamine pyrophosphate-binding protein n=1 Tax=Halostreptopolyspora alba TaxID=2487137 RepID=A0A3N0EDZ7_9ACTN|nr:thiamine pyrophosphate-binding protein [Nocardiopsaceae bacterium YIM 96095]
MAQPHGTGTPQRSVRDATLDVLRDHDLTTLFTNPGSTEVGFLAGLPEDLRLVLALHEGSVVGTATGWAIARDRPALVLLHTTAGLGNAVGALATARVNRAPLVVVVGQQDRRHLTLEPFLAGRLRDLAGDYPVRVEEPPTAQDVPGAVARCHHAAAHARGPAVVIVPMDDWAAPAEDSAVMAASRHVARADGVDGAAVDDLAALLTQADTPALVTGAGTDSEEGWAALTALAERLGAPVFQESFGARAGFPQDHPLFAGFLPADRPGLRATLAGHDTVLAVGAPVFRQYPYTEGALVEPGTRIGLLTDDPAEAYRSPVETAVLAPIPAALGALTSRVAPRQWSARYREAPEPLDRPAPGQPMWPAHVLEALAERAPADTIFVEETPSSRPEMHQRVPARRPLGFLSAAMGGLGFALPAAAGIRMARRDRPVIAVVGDGSSLYQVQALWSAARYGAGALFVVLSNGRYAVMDRLAEKHGAAPAWPDFPEVSVSGLSREMGCPARRVDTLDDLITVLDATVPTLRDRGEPLVLDVAVAVETEFQP